MAVGPADEPERSDAGAASAAGAAAATDRAADVTLWRVLAIAAPVVASNATVPIQGAVDTMIIGRLGAVAPLAAVGLGAEIFALLFTSFNFLQIGVSGLSAQALGAGRHERLAHVLLRGLALGALIGAALILLQAPIAAVMLSIFEASAETEALTRVYFDARIWGAPAELMNYALVGWFAGQERVRRLVIHQVTLAGFNVALNVLFVTVFDLGVFGVAIGTTLASWLGLGVGLWLARSRRREILPADWRPKRERLVDRAELARLFALNRDLFIRTLLLVGAFAWMARLGTLLGDDVLAANVVLWQFFIVSAYAMDGFAIASETLVGQALGARDVRRLDRSVRLATISAFALSAALSLAFWGFGGAIVDLFTTAPEIRGLARDYLLWAALIPMIGVWAFMLDGIFVGATGSAEMRDSMILSAIVYFPLSYWLMLEMGNHGVWLAVWIWLVLRALTLLWRYPGVRARAFA